MIEVISHNLIWVVLAMAIFILLLGVFVFTLENKGPLRGYRKLDVLLSPAERSFFGVLDQAVEDNAVIFCKVRVADVIAPQKGLDRRNWQRLFNKISSKHFDFILCDKGDLSVLCAIELDDKSHHSRKRKSRDSFLETVCESANFPLIRTPVRAAYKVDEIRSLLLDRL